VLDEQLEALDDAVAREYAVPEERDLASRPDLQGLR
jgi:hypothetical protein